MKAAPAAKFPHAARWYKHIAHLQKEKITFPGTKKAASAYGPSAAAADEDDIDLFGSDDEEEDAEAEKLKQERLAAYHAKKAASKTLLYYTFTFLGFLFSRVMIQAFVCRSIVKNVLF